MLYQLSYLGAAPARAAGERERGGYRGSIPGCPDERGGPETPQGPNFPELGELVQAGIESGAECPYRA